MNTNNEEEQQYQRESLSPIIHRKSSIGINYGTNRLSAMPINFNTSEDSSPTSYQHQQYNQITPQPQSNQLNQLNNMNQLESSSIQSNDHYKSTLLSENTFSYSDNPYININSSNDDMYPSN